MINLKQFLYIDLFIIIPVAVSSKPLRCEFVSPYLFVVSVGRTLPFPKIYPKRPTASLVSKKVLASLLGQVVLTSGVQFFTFFWVRRQEW